MLVRERKVFYKRSQHSLVSWCQQFINLAGKKETRNRVRGTLSRRN